MKRMLAFWLFAIPAVLVAQNSEASVGVKNYNFSTFHSEQLVGDLEEVAASTEERFQSHPEYGHLPYRTQCDDCYELVDRRTLDSRYFEKKGSSGSTFYVQQIYGQLHYEDANGWLRTIDERLRPLENGVYGAPFQPVPTFYDHNTGNSGIRSDELTLEYNGVTRLLLDQGGTETDLGLLDKSNFSVGTDGIHTVSAWPNVDRLQMFRQGGIKTNFVLNGPVALPTGTDWVILEDRFELPTGLTLAPDPSKGSFTQEGWWQGDLVMNDANGAERFRMRRPVITDANPDKYGRADLIQDFARTFIAYDYEVNGNEVVLRVRVAADWLSHPGRVFPIVIDPLVTGSSTFTAGAMGFRYDATCWSATNYCAYNLNVNVPGQSEITDAYFDAHYVSEIWGCGIFVDCWMSEAGFTIEGPCGQTPVPPNYWTCLSPTGDASGDCTGLGLPAFATVDCIPPQCAPYSLNFQMRTRYCFCSSSGCPTDCQYMPNNSWVMTVEARTIESGATANSTPVIFNGSCNIPLVINGVPSYGVPGYTYAWNTGPTPNQQSQTVTHATDGNYMYQVTVTDLCGATSVSNVTVVIANCPLAVEVEYFNAEADGATNRLSWALAENIELENVVVERSGDNASFDVLGRMETVSEMFGAQSFWDREPLSLDNHYRLRMTELNGEVSYSEVVRVRRASGASGFLVEQQGENLLEVRWMGAARESGELLLFALDGKEMMRKPYRESPGELTSVPISTTGLASGVYLLRLKGQSKRVVVQ